MTGVALIIFGLIWYFVVAYLKKRGHSAFLRHGLGVFVGFFSLLLWLVLASQFEIRKSEDAEPDQELTSPVVSVVAQVDDTEKVQVDDGILTAQQYLAEYQANEVAADLKYHKEKIVIKGVIHEIKKGALGGIYVHLATSDSNKSVSASFEDAQTLLVARLSKGQTVVLSCTGGGYFFGQPSLRDCEQK